MTFMGFDGASRGRCTHLNLVAIPLYRNCGSARVNNLPGGHTDLKAYPSEIPQCSGNSGHVAGGGLKKVEMPDSCVVMLEPAKSGLAADLWISNSMRLSRDVLRALNQKTIAIGRQILDVAMTKSVSSHISKCLDNSRRGLASAKLKT